MLSAGEWFIRVECISDQILVEYPAAYGPSSETFRCRVQCMPITKPIPSKCAARGSLTNRLQHRLVSHSGAGLWFVRQKTCSSLITTSLHTRRISRLIKNRPLPDGWLAREFDEIRKLSETAPYHTGLDENTVWSTSAAGAAVFPISSGISTPFVEPHTEEHSTMRAKSASH